MLKNRRELFPFQFVLFRMKFLFLSIYLIATTAVAQEKDLTYFYSKAQAAYKAKSYTEFYTLIQEAHRLHPYHQGILYQLGMAAALTGHKDEAIENLKKAILIDASFRLSGLADFDAIKNTPEFASLLSLQKECQRQVIHSDTAFVIRDRQLHAEGIEYDPSQRVFYLGSIHKRKVIKVSADRKISDFCTSAFQGMTSVFGMKADLKKNTLWVCSSPMEEMENYDSAARSAVYQFNLRTGDLIEKIQRPVYEKDGVFGDLILNKSGDVFIPDSQTNTIFIVNEKTHQLEPFFTSSEFWNIQGIAFSDDEKFLFIADYVSGLYRLTIKTKTLVPLACDLEISLKGIDGLNFVNRSLIAVQNGTNPKRVTRYRLNPDLDKIISFEIIDRQHPAFNEPTLGVLSNNVFYYIANSQWEGYDRNHHIKPENQLRDIVVLRYVLPDKR
jgi:hypothetical protein